MNFAHRIVNWQSVHGRQGLPWQDTQDPYRIWLSEIMLQQTQVVTVITYYQRFLERFPTIAALAAASQEDVMPFWAGLGYYARARNLHRCAQALVADWGGKFPPSAAEISTLPGIGRSTAAAIAAFAYAERSPILDGNVKRVFTRHFGIDGEPAKREIEKRLWQLADAQVEQAPDLNMARYTQGLMDLGATLCTRGKPDCARCPVGNTCVAKRDGRQKELPTPKARKTLPERKTGMLVLHHGGAIFLQQRPSQGIWGGLWSLPEFDAASSPQAAAQALGLNATDHYELTAFAHTFSHYRLHIRPCYMSVGIQHPTSLSDSATAEHCWVSGHQLASMALPAPVKKLLTGLFEAGLPQS